MPTEPHTTAVKSQTEEKVPTPPGDAQRFKVVTTTVQPDKVEESVMTIPGIDAAITQHQDMIAKLEALKVKLAALP